MAILNINSYDNSRQNIKVVEKTEVRNKVSYDDFIRALSEWNKSVQNPNSTEHEISQHGLYAMSCFEAVGYDASPVIRSMMEEIKNNMNLRSERKAK